MIEAIKKNPLETAKIKELPFYKENKGLSLGAMTSQFLSIFYLYKLDHYIVHTLGLSSMVHYMDDIVIIHHNKDVLKSALTKITNVLKDDYKLEVNHKKTRIVSCYDGFTFLGYRFSIKNKKTIIQIKKDTVKKINKRVKKLKYLYAKNYINFEKVFCSLNTYLYSFKYASNFKVVKIVDKYFINNKG